MATDPGKARRVFSGVDKLGGICFGRGKTRRINRRGKNSAEFSGAGQKLDEFFPRGKNSPSFCPAPENSTRFSRARKFRRVLFVLKQISPSFFRAGKTRRVEPVSEKLGEARGHFGSSLWAHSARWGAFHRKLPPDRWAGPFRTTFPHMLSSRLSSGSKVSVSL